MTKFGELKAECSIFRPQLVILAKQLINVQVVGARRRDTAQVSQLHRQLLSVGDDAAVGSLATGAAAIHIVSAAGRQIEGLVGVLSRS